MRSRITAVGRAATTLTILKRPKPQMPHLESRRLLSAKILFSLGAAKSRKARTLIGRNRLAVYMRLTGSG